MMLSQVILLYLFTEKRTRKAPTVAEEEKNDNCFRSRHDEITVKVYNDYCCKHNVIHYTKFLDRNKIPLFRSEIWTV